MNHVMIATVPGAGTLKVFAWPSGELRYSCEVRNDAVGGEGYGHLARCPLGDYVLAAPQPIAPPIASEGAWQIPLIDADKLWALAGRGDIMIHGGGTASPDPLAPNQGFFPTEGCFRVLNDDLGHLASILTEGDRLTVT